MNGTDLLTTRRSVRKFKDQAVTAEDIKGIIEIAKYAPSWKNTQTPRYIAVLDDDMKKQVASDCVLGFESNQKTISAAPALIVVTTIDGRSGYEKDGTPTTSKGTHWQSFDAGIATQTFCLAAWEKGFGTVVMGIFDEQKVINVIRAVESRSVSALIALGVPDEEPKAPKRKGIDDLLTVK